ncbi:MAG: hypothetical protein AAF740_03935 [Bacteroidota bacterium]
MAYKDFTLSDLRDRFKIENTITNLFDGVTLSESTPSDFLKQQLEEAQELPVKSEKARSELIISPILLELRRKNDKFFTIYSGDSLIVDKNKGLTGECDFILAKDTGSFSINIPILAIVEAKRQDMELGINQCAAQLYGAYLLNQKSGISLDKIYGCVTTADDWKFMRLQEGVIQIDRVTYYKSELGKILGIFQEIINFYKKQFQAA